MKYFLIILLLVPINISAYSTSATSSILMNMDNGQIIYGNNIDLQRPIASISKIMTAILAIESNKLEETVIVGEEINEAYGSAIYIKEGEEISLKSLVYGLMLRSGNDASLSIAKQVSGDVEVFVDLMNSKAKDIGMKNTIFNNPNGLDDQGGNISTAYDMAILTSYAMKNNIYQEITSTKNYKVTTNFNSYSWTNKHRLLFEEDYITGGKTGYTDVARRTLVTTASLNNINLVAVTLNDGNDFNDHIRLFEEAYSNLYSYKLLNQGTLNIDGEKLYTKDKLYIKNDYFHIFDNSENDIIIKYKLEELDKYSNHQKVGIIEIIVNGTIAHTEDIYIEILSKNIFDKIKEFFKW